MPTVIFLGGIVIEIAIAMAFVLNLFTTTNYSARVSGEAYLAAISGIEDGIIRVVRNKECPNGTGCSSSYDLPVGLRTASVTICDTCISGKTRVEALGSAGPARRKLRAVLTVNDVTGEVDIDSLSEIAI